MSFCWDVYVWLPRRDPELLRAFIDRYVDPEAPGDDRLPAFRRTYITGTPTRAIHPSSARPAMVSSRTSTWAECRGDRRRWQDRGGIMKVRNSLRSLKSKPGSVVTRRRGRMVVINRKNPRWNGRQG